MRIVCYDLETSDLKALMGRVLCCSFLPIIDKEFLETIPKKYHPKPYSFRGDSEEYINPDDPSDDSKLVVAIRDELKRYNTIVTWNGKMFDNRFLNAKLLEYGEDPLQTQFHYDPMWTVRNGLRVGSAKLVNVQKFLDLPDMKSEITWKDWQRALSGDSEAMNTVVEHCELDVKVLMGAYWRLLKHARTWPKG